MTPDDVSPRYSIVVPTYERAGLLAVNLPRLADLLRPWPCEVVVVVDGSRDGSREAAEAVELPFPKTVLFQQNAGAAAARNAGAAVARGEFLLFLDDDMAAEPALLVEHDKLLSAGADAVVGHIPLLPGLPKNVLTVGVARWAEQRLERLNRPDRPVTLGDLLTGQLSVRSSTFREMGGFDTQFTAGGSFGAEDTDFLYRLVVSGAQLRAAPRAVSYQHYVVTPEQHLRQWRQGGRADALLIRKHPELREQLDAQHRGHTVTGRGLRALQRKWPAVISAWEPRLVARAAAGHADLLTQWAFGRLRDAAYWSGRQEAESDRGPSEVRVLAYHAVEAVDDPVVAPWCVPPDELAAQLESLLADGWTFVDSATFLAALRGAVAPQRSALLTFDDGYASFAAAAVPVLRRLQVPATVFLVSGLLGEDNRWDVERGAVSLPLMDAATVLRLQAEGWSFGVHSRTHAHLGTLAPWQLAHEVDQPRQDLVQAGLDPVPMFAYPYGEHSALVRRAARRAGYQVAFALEDGARPDDAYGYPRVEVRQGMTGTEIAALLATERPRGGSRGMRPEVRALARMVLANLARAGSAASWRKT